ncbi:MAG: hypothetical protein V4564_10970 [Pseudomonadota bacterium]|uniref:hypothetical protein n=1 Tax=Sphingomonas sp. ERG5 TaxID=1381597 RepID=UPI00054BC3E8|nr:hypothetical protein [Sphingomonas sp. ERG5]
MKAINFKTAASVEIETGGETTLTESIGVAGNTRKAWSTPMVIVGSTAQQTTHYTVGFGTDAATGPYGPFGS